MIFVKFENGFISDVVSGIPPEGYIALPDDLFNSGIALCLIKPDLNIRTLEECIEVGLLPEPKVDEPIVEPEEIVLTYQQKVDRVNQNRKLAYSNSLNGSDPLFTEASRMQMMGETGWELVRDKAIQRYHEIQNEHPWPIGD